MVIIRTEVRELANRRLGALGLQLSFGDHVEVTDDFSSSPVEARLA
jgi:muramoyltetrapeptide carboxypeptidase LdcA involved in peptidoglycan recycling